MKKLSKNLAMYILCFCMFAAVFCAMTLKAEAANVTSGYLGDNNGISWTYDADTKTLTITGEDSGLRGSPFEQICGDVETIKVENCTIKGRADSMFSSLKSLKSVEFYNVDTTNVTNMSRMFSGCSNLERLDLSNLDTSNVTDMQYMFNGCSNLSSLSMSNKFNTGKVTSMYCMFKDCSKLSILDLRNFNTSNVIEMGYMFSGCKSLSSLDLSSFDTSKVTSMYSMFSICSSLNNLDVSSFNTSNVTDMYFMFNGCKSLSSLDLSNFNTEQVTGMYEMFYYCSNLESLNVSSFNTSNVTTMTGMFRGCSKLNSLDVSSFDTSNVFSIDNMFQDCSSLSSLNLSNFDLSKIATSSPALWGCSNLVRLETPKTMPETLFISSSNTYANASNERTTRITTDFCNTTLINVDYLISKIILNTSSITVHMGKNSQLTATISPEKAVNKTLIWKSSNTAVATVDASGKVTPVAPGTATITATATDYGKVSASCEVKVIYPVTGIVLSKTSTSLKVGGSETLAVTISPGNASDKAVTWKSSNTAVATVDSSGKINAVGPGTATITATAKDGSGKSASCSVTVIQPVTGISLNKTGISIKVGGSATLTVTVKPDNASNKAVTWTSSDTSVATVSSSGKVTAIAPGTATITVAAKDGSGKSASCSVTVTQPVTGIVLNKSSVNLKTYNTYTLTATVSPDNASNKAVIWTSSNVLVATVDSNGKITALGPGTATITAAAEDRSGKLARCSVTVTQPVTSVSLNKTAAKIHLGKSETLTVTVKPKNASNKEVTWTSSNTSVATVDANGKVTAVATGTATITVTAKDGSGKSASCEVTVIRPVTEVILNKNSVELVMGESETLMATVKPDNASNKTLTWTSSNIAVATVSGSGKITAVGPGTATITATAKDGSGKSASCSVTVVQWVSEVRLNKDTLSLKTGESEKLTVTILPEDATIKEVTWESSDTAVATVDANGKVTAVGRGTATITAITKDVTGARDSCEVTVTQPVTGITLNKTSLNLESGASETLTVTVSPSNASNKAVTWKSSNTAVATVDANGKVTAVAPGTVTITATAKDGSGKSASCSVTVTEPMSEQERQVRAFVERMYTVALGRASDPSGINYWTEELLSHRKDGASISAGFIMSEEFEKKNYSNEEYLKVLYRTFFDREADEGGKAFWLEQMKAGRSRKSVLAGFVNSKEFTEICESYGIDRGTMEDDATATGAGQFVERLYSIALERPSDPAGLKDWADRINNRTNTPEQVAKEFFLSPEYTAKKTSNDKYVETLYLVFMDRASEAGGKAYWVEQLNNGVSRESVLEGFAQSQEFKEIMARYGL